MAFLANEKASSQRKKPSIEGIADLYCVRDSGYQWIKGNMPHNEKNRPIDDDQHLIQELWLLEFPGS